MAQLLHFVYGGELVEPQSAEFRDCNKIDMIGVYPNYEAAYHSWKGAAQRTVDNAHMRYFIAHLHRLEDEEKPESGSDSPS